MSEEQKKHEMTDSEKLRKLADWFDIYDREKIKPENTAFVQTQDEVQKDLRRIAGYLDERTEGIAAIGIPQTLDGSEFKQPVK